MQKKIDQLDADLQKSREESQMKEDRIKDFEQEVIPPFLAYVQSIFFASHTHTQKIVLEQRVSKANVYRVKMQRLRKSVLVQTVEDGKSVISEAAKLFKDDVSADQITSCSCLLYTSPSPRD